MAHVHRPESTTKDSIGLRLRYLRCLDTVGVDEQGDPIVDLVEIEFEDGVWVGFTPDRRKVFFAAEREDQNPPVVVQADGSLQGAPGVTITRKRVQTPQHMTRRG